MNKQNGLAYDLSLFEPEPTQKPTHNKHSKPEENDSKVIRLDAGQSLKAQKRRRNPFVILSVSLLTLVVAAISSWIVYNNVVINELNDKILTANGTLANQDNLQAQYQLKIDRKLTTEIVQNYAETKLGMTKAKAAQKEFVSLTDGDQG